MRRRMRVVGGRRLGTGARRLGGLAMIMLAVAVDARAAQSTRPSHDLPLLSLEDLMQVQIEPVFGASKRLQPVTEAPASVTIVTADEIARYGYRTLADILRTVRGFSVTYDRHYSYVGVRGFAVPGDNNTRILLLVDGHRMNDNIYDQAPVGAELGLDPSTFDRVEIIRGPASSLYGTSAFFGVVNVITKTGAGLAGGRISGDAGSFGSASARASFGRRLHSTLDVAASGSYFRTGGPGRLFFPEFANAPAGGVAVGLDDEDARQVSGRVARGGLTVSGAFGRREKGVPTAAYNTVFGDPRFRTTDSRSFLDAQYGAAVGQTRLDVRASIDRYRHVAHRPTLRVGDPSVVTVVDDEADGLWVGLEGRGSRRLGPRQRLTLGVEARHDLRQSHGGRDVDGALFDMASSGRTVGAYLQDEITVTKAVTVHAGVRFDAYSAFSRLTPRLAVIVRPSSGQAFKYLYGSAFRAPNPYELGYYPAAPGAPPLAPETTDTHEIVWERYTGRWLRTSASFYANRADSLISLSADDFVGFTFVNLGQVRARGLEIEAEVRHRQRIQGRASYVVQRTTDGGSAVMIGSPPHTLKAQLSVSGPARLVMSADLQHMSRRRTLRHDTVDPVTLVHGTVRLPIRHGLLLTATVRNLLGRTYADPGSGEHLQDAIMQDGRTFRVGFEWGLGSTR